MRKFIYIVVCLVISFTVFAGSADSSDQKKYDFVFGLNDEYETPYYAFVGKSESPKILIHGGMHGDEIAGYLACQKIVDFITLKNGTLIIIPKLNKPACDNNVRGVNMDLNHAFPGDLSSDTYEYRLAYELMYIVDSIKPDLIINLHEARNKYTPSSGDDANNAYGQIVITCIQPFEQFMLNVIEDVNTKIPFTDQQFRPHYYRFSEYSSLDNFVAKFNIPSYTVETWRGFDVDTRVKLQELIILQFLNEEGVKYDYPDISMN